MKAIFFTLVCLLFFIPIHAQGVVGLREKLKRGETREALEAILEAGKSGDKAFVPYLKELASRPDFGPSIYTLPSYAQMALAKLGEEPYLSAIIKDLDSTNIFAQDRAIERLGKVGGRPAFKEFFRLLDDKKYRSETVTDADIAKMREIGATVMRKGDQILEPRSFLVMKLLSTLVENPPVSPDAIPTEKDIPIWKVWFDKHRSLFE